MNSRIKYLPRNETTADSHHICTILTGYYHTATRPDTAQKACNIVQKDFTLILHKLLSQNYRLAFVCDFILQQQ